MEVHGLSAYQQKSIAFQAFRVWLASTNTSYVCILRVYMGLLRFHPVEPSISHESSKYNCSFPAHGAMEIT